MSVWWGLGGGGKSLEWWLLFPECLTTVSNSIRHESNRVVLFNVVVCLND